MGWRRADVPTAGVTSAAGTSVGVTNVEDEEVEVEVKVAAAGVTSAAATTAEVGVEVVREVEDEVDLEVKVEVEVSGFATASVSGNRVRKKVCHAASVPTSRSLYSCEMK